MMEVCNTECDLEFEHEDTPATRPQIPVEGLDMDKGRQEEEEAAFVQRRGSRSRTRERRSGLKQKGPDEATGEETIETVSWDARPVPREPKRPPPAPPGT